MQTDRQTDARDHNTFRVVYDSTRNVIDLFILSSNTARRNVAPLHAAAAAKPSRTAGCHGNHLLTLLADEQRLSNRCASVSSPEV